MLYRTDKMKTRTCRLSSKKAECWTEEVQRTDKEVEETKKGQELAHPLYANSVYLLAKTEFCEQ